MTVLCGVRPFERHARVHLIGELTRDPLAVILRSGRRPATAARVPSSSPEPTRYGEVLWLEPYPDALLEGIVDSAAGPEARYETREAVTLAFLTALHRLPPRQRAVLVLRDVLGFSATDVAAMLETTPASVNSALIRARAAIDERGPHARDRAPLPRSAQEQELVARFADAFEHGDVEPIVALLGEDAWWTMPPEPYGYRGRDAIQQFIAHAFATREDSRRLIPTRANTQPAFGHYAKDPHSAISPWSASERPRCTPDFTINRATTLTSPDARSLPGSRQKQNCRACFARGSGSRPGLGSRGPLGTRSSSAAVRWGHADVLPRRDARLRADSSRRRPGDERASL